VDPYTCYTFSVRTRIYINISMYVHMYTYMQVCIWILLYKHVKRIKRSMSRTRAPKHTFTQIHAHIHILRDAHRNIKRSSRVDVSCHNNMTSHSTYDTYGTNGCDILRVMPRISYITSHTPDNVSHMTSPATYIIRIMSRRRVMKYIIEIMSYDESCHEHLLEQILSRHVYHT